MTYEEFRAARKHLTKSDYYTYAELESAGSNVGFACDRSEEHTSVLQSR